MTSFVRSNVNESLNVCTLQLEKASKRIKMLDQESLKKYKGQLVEQVMKIAELQQEYLNTKSVLSNITVDDFNIDNHKNKVKQKINENMKNYNTENSDLINKINSIIKVSYFYDIEIIILYIHSCNYRSPMRMRK